MLRVLRSFLSPQVASSAAPETPRPSAAVRASRTGERPFIPVAPVKLRPAPESLTDAQGQPNFGTFRGSLKRIDRKALQGAFRPDRMDRMIRDKKWVFTSVYARTNDQRRVAVVSLMGDMGYAGTGFLAVYDMDSGQRLAHRNFTGPNWAGKVGAEPAHGLEASYRGAGANLSISRPHGSDTYHHRASMPAFRDMPAVDLNLQLQEVAHPVTTIAPSGERSVALTQKTQAMPGRGTLRVGDQRWTLSDVHAAIDYTYSDMPRRTAWRWASSSGTLKDGSRFGLNLAEGLHENTAGATENAFWVDDQIHTLPKVAFEFDPKNTLAPWRVTNAEGDHRFRVDLHFAPANKIGNHSQLGLVRIHYEQPVGHWTGRITDTQSGRTFELDRVVGLAEDQDSTW